MSLINNAQLIDCDNQLANYIGIEYKFIPITSSTNFTICDNTPVNSKFGIITSVNYPQWQGGQSCSRSISVPANNIIRVYITDISIEAANQNNNE